MIYNLYICIKYLQKAMGKGNWCLVEKGARLLLFNLFVPFYLNNLNISPTEM